MFVALAGGLAACTTSPQDCADAAEHAKGAWDEAYIQFQIDKVGDDHGRGGMPCGWAGSPTRCPPDSVAAAYQASDAMVAQTQKAACILDGTDNWEKCGTAPPPPVLANAKVGDEAKRRIGRETLASVSAAASAAAKVEAGERGADAQDPGLYEARKQHISAAKKATEEASATCKASFP